MDDEKIQAATAITTAEYDKLKRKADLWDQYAIYDNDNEPEILVKDLIIAYEKLESIRKLHKEFGWLTHTELKEILGIEICECGHQKTDHEFLEDLEYADHHCTISGCLCADFIRRS